MLPFLKLQMLVLMKANEKILYKSWKQALATQDEAI